MKGNNYDEKGVAFKKRGPSEPVKLPQFTRAYSSVW